MSVHVFISGDTDRYYCCVIERYLIMAMNRYVKDYRLVETVDERGRIRTELEYIGDRYEYVSDKHSLKNNRIIVFVTCILAWLGYIVALIPVSVSMHTIYISMPFLFTALPLAIMTEILITAPNGSKVLEHRQADKLSNRYPAAAVFIIILAGFPFAVGLIRSLVSGDNVVGDILFLVCAALITACGILLFIKRRSFDTRKV